MAPFDTKTRESLNAFLVSVGLAPFAAVLAKAARFSVGFNTSEQDVPVGGSKLGGLPDLPRGTPWPVRQAMETIHPNQPAEVDAYLSSPQPLTFIAQINFATLPADAASTLNLPETGLLLLFYDMAHQGWGFDPQDITGFKTLYVEDTADLARLTAPTDDPLFRVLGELGLTGEIKLIAVPSEGIHMEALHLPQEAMDIYSDDLDLGIHDDHHRLGGWPSLIQNPMEEECALVTSGINTGDPDGWHSDAAKAVLAQPNDWQLLLQIGEESDIGLDLVDYGMLYLWIRKADLQALRFDRCWLILQTS